MHVSVSADLAEGDLVEAGEGDLAAVGMTGQHQGDTVRPQEVGLFGDVGQRKRGKIAAQAGHRLADARVSGVGVVEADDLNRLAAHRERGVLVAQDLDPGSPQG